MKKKIRKRKNELTLSKNLISRGKKALVKTKGNAYNGMIYQGWLYQLIDASNASNVLETKTIMAPVISQLNN